MDKNVFSNETLDWVRRLRDAALVSDSSGAIRTGSTPIQLDDRLRPVLDDFRAQARDARIEIIEALSEETDSITTRILLGIADCDEDWQLRLSVLNGLLAGPIEEGVKGLMHVAETDIDPEVRAEAIRHLGKLALGHSSRHGGRGLSGAPVQGAIRTGAGTISREDTFSEQTEAALYLLDQLRSRDPSTDVRRAADQTLRQFDR
jgi:HEAT repeat protein